MGVCWPTLDCWALFNRILIQSHSKFSCTSGIFENLSENSRIPMASYSPLCTLRCPCSSGDTAASSNCLAVGKVEAVLHRFGLPSFRPGQLESVLPALHGRDVFVKMATGAGKSLCMFLVPLAYSDLATAVIISPLVTLMNEQVLIACCVLILICIFVKLN